MPNRTAPLYALAAALSLANAAHALDLRESVDAKGPHVTLGDVFEGAGPHAARVIAAAPPPGKTLDLDTQMIADAARDAGLAWTPPPGLSALRVNGPAPRPVRAASAALASGAPVETARAPAAQKALIKRGDSIVVEYAAPGLRLSVRAKALEDGAAGETIRVANPQSNAAFDAVVQGPGLAAAGPRAQAS